jgi:hypothetical protein
MELIKPGGPGQSYDDRPHDSSIVVRLPRVHVPYGVRVVVSSVLLTVAMLTPSSVAAPSNGCAPAKRSSSHQPQDPWPQRAEFLLGAALLVRRGAAEPAAPRRTR